MAQDSPNDDKHATEVHFCVLVHGLWGSPSHLAQLTKSLHTAHPGDHLHTLVTKSNSGNYTYDGIETGGERVTHEVEDELASLSKAGKTVTKISVVGYSLGGLIARYAIGLLYTAGVFDKITPVNFTTFATPHLGTRTPLLGWNNHIFNVMGARTLSTSGQQLWLIDDFRKSGRPLLALLADPESIFMRALSSFKNRSLYANIVNDRAVPFYTACISPIDPFPDIDNLILNTIPDTEDVLLQHPQGEPEHSSEMATPRTGERTYYDAISAGARNFWNKAPFYFFLTTLAPFGIMAFMANAGVQSVRSAQRIKEHEEGKAGPRHSPVIYAVHHPHSQLSAIVIIITTIHTRHFNPNTKPTQRTPPSPVLLRRHRHRRNLLHPNRQSHSYAHDLLTDLPLPHTRSHTRPIRNDHQSRRRRVAQVSGAYHARES